MKYHFSRSRSLYLDFPEELGYIPFDLIIEPAEGSGDSWYTIIDQCDDRGNFDYINDVPVSCNEAKRLAINYLEDWMIRNNWKEKMEARKNK